ncbi:hypothetical protein GGF50DRAFT_67229, partial [Schizophyllum commune]
TFKNDKDLLSAEPGRATIAMIRAGFCPEGAQALPYRHRKAAITRALNACILAPVRRLPTEILELIFLAFIEGHDNPYGWARILRANIIPVCFRWRATARGFPCMWTYVDVSRPPAPLTRWWSRLHPDQVVSQIGLSGQLPLAVQYNCNSQMDLAPILDHCAPRLQSFSFAGSYYDIEDQPQFDLPMLRSTVIAIGGWISNLTLAVIARAPVLEHLSLVQSWNHLAAFAHDPWYLSMNVHFPRFPRLTYLSISVVTPLTASDLWRVLESCQHTLATLLVNAMISRSTAASTPMLTLTSLQTIDLSYNAISIESFLSTPNVVSVALRDISETIAPPCIFGSIRRLASSTAMMSLRCVTLERVSSWSACLADTGCMQAMVSVERLQIIDIPTTITPPRRYVPFMRAMAMLHTPGQQPLFPSLKYLSLLCGGHHIEDGLQDAMDDFHDSRRAEVVGQVARLEVFDTNVERDATFNMYDSEDEEEIEVEISLLTNQ